MDTDLVDDVPNPDDAGLDYMALPRRRAVVTAGMLDSTARIVIRHRRRFTGLLPR